MIAQGADYFGSNINLKVIPYISYNQLTLPSGWQKSKQHEHLILWATDTYKQIRFNWTIHRVVYSI